MTLLLLTSFLIAKADTVNRNPSHEPTTKITCLDFKPTTSEKKDRTYKALKKLFTKNKISVTEILARLIASETKAAGTHCQADKSEIAHHIASSLDNRIQKRNGDIISVVFQPQQFASSLHFYDESQVQEFLCPKDLVLMGQALNWTRSMELKTYTNTLPKDSVNYYLYKHSPRFKPPAWIKTLKEAPVDKKLSPCIRFFENKSFK